MRRVDETEIFKALSVPSRMRILMLLKAEGPLPVKTLAEKLGMTAPAVSQHLKALRYVGLVRSERNGYFVPYEVNERNLSDCCGAVVRICACSEEECGESEEEGTSEALAELLERRRTLLAELRGVEEEIAREEEGGA
jgi:DNA-binding transcriptional ArsR family regulator